MVEERQAVYLIIVTIKVTVMEAAESMIHATNTNNLVQLPQIGTQMNIHISTRVAKPMGMVPRNRELIGS